MPELVVALTRRGGPRVHRATCRRVHAAVPVSMVRPVQVLRMPLATCCKPTDAARVGSVLDVPGCGCP